MIVSPARRLLRACLYNPSATSTAVFLYKKKDTAIIWLHIHKIF